MVTALFIAIRQSNIITRCIITVLTSEKHVCVCNQYVCMHVHPMSTTHDPHFLLCCIIVVWVFVPASSWALNCAATCCNQCFLTTVSLPQSCLLSAWCCCCFVFLKGFVYQPWPATGCIKSLNKKPNKKTKSFVLLHVVLFHIILSWPSSLSNNTGNLKRKNRVSFAFCFPR